MIYDDTLGQSGDRILSSYITIIHVIYFTGKIFTIEKMIAYVK